MPLLLDSDYNALEERGLDFVEDEQNRFLIIHNYQLTDGIYHEDSCDVLVIIPKNYNQAGNDMFWTSPHLTRFDDKPIPRMDFPGSRNNQTFEGEEFCRWSRHWNQGDVVWKPGKDNVITILRRITWALGNPDAQ